MFVKYTLFALIATIVNLLSQYLFFLIYIGLGSLYIGMFIGTLAGLFVKYILDKNFIFFYKVDNLKDNTKKFTLYSFMGIFTTAIFWGTEIAFDYIIQTPNARYLGAIIGLSAGYILKYHLDKKFVFIYKEGRV
tara:strand:- start:985 stop:1386 length:402 start_codon:yes stop_codon:yes gene_type:complete